MKLLEKHINGTVPGNSKMTLGQLDQSELDKMASKKGYEHLFEKEVESEVYKLTYKDEEKEFKTKDELHLFTDTLKIKINKQLGLKKAFQYLLVEVDKLNKGGQ